MNIGIDIDKLKIDLFDFVSIFGAKTDSPYFKVKITINEILDNTDYIVTIDSDDFVFNSGIGATQEGIIAGLISEIESGATGITINDYVSFFEIQYNGNTNGFTLSVSNELSFLPQAIVFWLNQNAPSLPDPKFGITFLSGIDQIGTDNKFYNTDDNSFKVDGLRSFILTVQSFGNNSFQYLFKLKNYLNLDSSEIFLDGCGLAVANNPNILNITTMMETTYEERYTMDIEFYIKSSLTEDISDIYKIRSSYDIDNISGNLDIN